MLILVFLKMAADLGFYSTFAGLLGAIPAIEIQPSVIVISVPALALVFTLSYLLRKPKVLRFLPFLLVPLLAFLPGFSLSSAVFLLPPVVYMIILAAKRLYEPDYGSEASFFSLYWKLAIPALIIAAVVELAGGQKILTMETVPLVLITLTSSVLLTRTLRHEPSAYSRPPVVLLNVGVAVLVMAGAFVLSSQTFRDGVIWFVKTISMPVVYLLSAIVVGLTRLFMWLMSLLPYNTPEEELPPTVTEETLEPEPYETPETDIVIPPGIERVITAVAIVIVILLIVLLFRWLIKHRKRFFGQRRNMAEERSNTSVKPRKKPLFDRSPDMAVRRQYRKYLKQCVKEGMSLPIWYTSEDVARKSNGYFTRDSIEELREIYLDARYDGNAGPEEVKRAKELVRGIQNRAPERLRPGASEEEEEED